MSTKKKQEFIALHDRILELGQDFSSQAHPSNTSVTLDINSLQGVPKSIIGSLQSSASEKGQVTIETSSSISNLILRTAREERVRRDLFMALNSANDYQVGVLEELLKTRADLAKLLGKANYAELHLQDKMVEKPGIFKNIEADAR